MKYYTIQELKQRFSELGFSWFNLHIIGIREKNNKPDAFDDFIYVVWGQSLYRFSCTTEPGVHWLQNLLNPKGTAVVKADMQYIDVYKLGLHKGEPALEQAGDLMGYRDADKDHLAEAMGEAIVLPASCKINIHSASKTAISVIIGKWSAGCQVLNNSKEWQMFISIFKKAVQQRFTYTLLNEF